MSNRRKPPCEFCHYDSLVYEVARKAREAYRACAAVLEAPREPGGWFSRIDGDDVTWADVRYHAVAGQFNLRTLVAAFEHYLGTCPDEHPRPWEARPGPLDPNRVMAEAATVTSPRYPVQAFDTIDFGQEKP